MKKYKYACKFCHLQLTYNPTATRPRGTVDITHPEPVCDAFQQAMLAKGATLVPDTKAFRINKTQASSKSN